MQAQTQITSAKNRGHYVVINWNHEKSSRFHSIWLRDNCHHSTRFDIRTGERTALSEMIPENLAVESTKILPNGDLRVHWSDHSADSTFKSDWLWDNRYEQESLRADNKLKITSWKSDYGKNIKTFKISQLQKNKDLLVKMIDTFSEYGLIRITDVPVRNNEVERFANWLAYVREIIFDRVADIKVSVDPYTVGFTSQELPLHTDCSGYTWPPNVMAFHCLQNSVRGGDPIYSDGATAVQYLHQNTPDALKTLTTAPVDYRLFSSDADTCHASPPIVLTPHGELKIIRHANWAVQPIRGLDFEKVLEYYNAHRLLSHAINLPLHMTKVHCKPGDLLLINNHRVLHGRNAFDHTTGMRHFQQVYMEMDDLLSRKRVLNRSIGENT